VAKWGRSIPYPVLYEVDEPTPLEYDGEANGREEELLRVGVAASKNM
jgi:hypothetical protein